MKAPVDVNRLKPVNPQGLRGDSRELYAEAQQFICSFEWNRGIAESYVAFAVPKVIGIFLIAIIPDRPEIDQWLWVIVGDIPPAYLVTDKAPDGASALRQYIDEMRRWVAAVKAGASLENVIPVNVEPTIYWADQLDDRLAFLEERVIPEVA